MERYNPQIGNYASLQIEEVTRTGKNTIALGNEKYDSNGRRKATASCLYGSATYYILSIEDAQKACDIEAQTFNGIKTHSTTTMEKLISNNY